jgi:putative acetyltransferase
MILNIRAYDPKDLDKLVQLFKQAVQAINIQHYSQEQVDEWTNVNVERWRTTLAQNITFVAEVDGVIAGFADMTHEGYLDHLYIHKDFQGRWVSAHLLRAIEKAARGLGLAHISTHCSITAKKPAERMGFVVIKEQTVQKNGVSFINYVMEKKLKD